VNASVPFIPDNAIEAVADALASIDGKLCYFRSGKFADSIEDFGGHYAGYMSEATELILRIEKRGYKIVKFED
jgi:hypothetical protein